MKTIYNAGVATEIGVEPTVRHAADLGYIPIIPTDVCGAGDAATGEHAMHLLEHMGDAVFTTTSELVEVLKP